ncbi:GIY-YIG nuclease family protein [Rosistilla carotiformis]|uniref:GIY-YIG nuclease family protein n=1 Tax=Rosistilla carotiformis TaxID=2528017 RepID=UPI001E393160|nr:GIY-YIG nuclease family protein [Rosistilla carotiformis]
MSKPLVSPSPSPTDSPDDAEPQSVPAPWFVYILRCEDRSLYTGISKDLARRLKQHNAGTASRYTRSRLPVAIVYHEQQPDQSAALKRELAIKALPRQAKEKLIASDRNQIAETDSPL